MLASPKGGATCRTEEAGETTPNEVRSGEPPRNRTENPQIKSHNGIEADDSRPQNIAVGCPTPWSSVPSFGAVSRPLLQILANTPSRPPQARGRSCSTFQATSIARSDLSEFTFSP